MRFSTDALVIKEKIVNESDRLVTLMTRDRGVINAFAAGAKSIKSKKGAATSLLSFSDFNIEEKNGIYRIREAAIKHCFFSVGQDILDLALSQYFCEICCVLGTSDSDCEEFLRIILNSLYFLSTKKKSNFFIKTVTELRIACECGYKPDLVACCECGKYSEDETAFFKIDDGVLFCSECKSGENCVKVSPAVLKAMRHTVYSELNKLYSFDLSENAAREMSGITEKYITYQTEHHFKTLDFYNSLL